MWETLWGGFGGGNVKFLFKDESLRIPIPASSYRVVYFPTKGILPVELGSEVQWDN